MGGLVIEGILALGADPSNVLPLVRSTAKGERFAARGMEPRLADFDDPASMRHALDGVDKLVLISSPSMDNPARLRQLYDAVSAAHEANIRHIAYVGLADPEDYAYGLEDVELSTEYAIRALGIPFTFLRNSVYLDEITPELRVALKTGELLSITGDHTMNWSPRADQASAIAGAIWDDRHTGKTYNLVSPRRYKYSDLARMLSEATGRSISYRHASAHEVIASLIAGGMNQDHAESMVEVFQGAIASGKWQTTDNDIQRLSGRSGYPTPEYISQILGLN